ncbi:MAG: adenosylcobinamide-GDP ribazoletransferase [Selenomonadaceae bacterium]|nr:adenosylcobinamide-GDP ribazoletransferase [Selenomonadaceae bacterium]
MNAFLIGLQFLTRISIVRQTVWTEQSFGESVKYFPAVGAVLGLCYSAAVFILTIIANNNLNIMDIPNVTTRFPMLEAAIILTLMAMLTGGIHCDGFMDTMDGLFSGRDRERIMQIMKDSRVGAFGVVSFVMISILNFAALTELAQTSTMNLMTAAYATPIIGRLMMVITIGSFPYARPEGMGKAFATYTTKSTILFAVVETLVLFLPLILLMSNIIKTLTISIIAASIFTFYFGNFSIKKIGGVTGDIYGAVTTISESIVLLIFVMI